MATALPLPLVDLPEQVVGEEREQLDERDARVAFVEIGPLRGIDGDPFEHLVPKVLVVAVVDGWQQKRHTRILAHMR